jgi:hypothetical protein
MTLEEVTGLLDYWVDHPPLHILAAAYLGIKPASIRGKPSTDYGELIAMFGGSL